MVDFKNWLRQEKNGLRNDFYAYPKEKILWRTLGILLLFLAIFRLWTLLSFQKMTQWDIWLVNQIEQLRNVLLIFFPFLSNLASGYFIIVSFLILAFFLVRKKMKKAAFTAFLTLVGSGLFIWILKNFFLVHGLSVVCLSRTVFLFPLVTQRWLFTFTECCLT